MATRAGFYADGLMPSSSSQKTRKVPWPVVNEPLAGTAAVIYKMRAFDTGATFVFWISADPNASYPGVPIGTITQKQIAAILRAQS